MAPMRTPVAFIGYSNSGKTTLLVSLVEHFVAAGERVALIKHTHHDPAKRKPRGDTERFIDAGASTVVLAGHGLAALMTANEATEERPFTSAAEIVSWLRADRVLVEGFKSLTTWPRILVERDGVEPMRPRPAVEAVVTDSSETLGVPTFRHDDIREIGAFLDRISAT